MKVWSFSSIKAFAGQRAWEPARFAMRASQWARILLEGWHGQEALDPFLHLAANGKSTKTPKHCRTRALPWRKRRAKMKMAEKLWWKLPWLKNHDCSRVTVSSHALRRWISWNPTPKNPCLPDGSHHLRVNLHLWLWGVSNRSSEIVHDVVPGVESTLVSTVSPVSQDKD